MELEDGGHLEMYYARADLCIGTSTQGIGEVLCDWASQDRSVYYSPIRIDSIHEHEEDFGALIISVLQGHLQVQELQAAFPAETQIEESFEQGTLDRVLDESGPEEEQSLLYRDPQQDLDEKLLEALPLAGFPKDEAERRREWAKIPRRTRIAIRRLHNMMSHRPKEVLLQVLRGSGAPEEMIRAAKAFRCPTCGVSQETPKKHPVSAPCSYVCNKEVSIDVLKFKTQRDKSTSS